MIQKLLLIAVCVLPGWVLAQAPCTVTNASGCVCAVSGQTDCDLLPDIKVSDWAILNYNGGPQEFSQTGNGADDGRLRVSSSTPNIGYGSFTVGSVSMWTCGNDTFTTFPGPCPGTGADPKQLIKQKIYHKNGNTMTFSERWAGSMTYHPSHGHMHVDDWCVLTLRIDNGSTDTLTWPIVGNGAKVGFCLMDFGTCSYYNNHCEDDNGNVMTNSSFPNYGLGGGNYNCSPVEQGISSGYTDIYGSHLDGMWIDIPPGTCNGNYWIIIEADPNNNFLESNENNNWAAVPFTLTKQVPSGSSAAVVQASGSLDLCPGEDVTLTASAGSSFNWSTGDTTQSITVNSGGSYTVTVTSPCGTGASNPVVVNMMAAPSTPTTVGDTVCQTDPALVMAMGSGTFNWWDQAVGGTLLHTGSSYNTPSLAFNTTYYVEAEMGPAAANYQVGPTTGSIGTGNYHYDQSRYLEFDATVPFLLKSVWVDAQTSGTRVIDLRDNTGSTIASTSVNIPAGQSRVTLNMQIPQGTNLRLATGNIPGLYRNDGGVNYPYSVASVASIHGSSAGSQYYYYFYDWEIETIPATCRSPRVPADVLVHALPVVSMTGLAGSYHEADAPVTLTGMPAGGTFSGPGIAGNVFDPGAAGAGGPYNIVYSYTDMNGCENTTVSQVTVQSGVDILDASEAAHPMVFPNPADNEIEVLFELNATHHVRLELISITGEVLIAKDYGQFSGAFREKVNIESLAGGVYFVKVQADERAYFQKLIVK